LKEKNGTLLLRFPLPLPLSFPLLRPRIERSREMRNEGQKGRITAERRGILEDLNYIEILLFWGFFFLLLYFFQILLLSFIIHFRVFFMFICNLDSNTAGDEVPHSNLELKKEAKTGKEEVEKKWGEDKRNLQMGNRTKLEPGELYKRKRKKKRKEHIEKGGMKGKQRK
jgi:hypothetical protein